MKAKKIIVLVSAILLFLYLLTWIPWLLVRASADIVDDIESLPQSDVAIVFGGIYRSNEPMSEINEERLLTAAELFREGYVEKIVVSNTEVAAKAMRDYLVHNGIDTSVIEIDNSAVVTEDTCITEYNAHRGERSVIFISQKYHLPRIVYMCEQIGISGVGFPAEELELAQRTDLPLYTTMQIRYNRHRREAALLLLGILNIYQPTLSQN